MGNKVQGKIDFNAGEKQYTLHFTTNAMCELEAAADTSIMAFLKHLDTSAKDENLRMGDVRLLFWAGLKEHHPDMTVQQAGALMQEIGGLEKAMQLAGDAVAVAFPQGETTGSNPEGKAKGAS